MILAVAATEMEMQPFLRACAARSLACPTLVAGVGPLEAAARLAGSLARRQGEVRAAINFGIAGAYLQAPGTPQPQLLDLCLASSEVFGDLGLAYPDRVDSLPEHLLGDQIMSLDGPLFDLGQSLLAGCGLTFQVGAFVTVAATSATSARGRMLQARWQGLCENMEGAALARVCREFSVPMLEIRAISNHVEDRHTDSWQLPQACEKAAEAAVCLLQGLLP